MKILIQTDFGHGIQTFNSLSFQDNIFKFEPIVIADEKSIVDDADDVIVTEEDVDEELIEIDVSYNSEIQESVIQKVENEIKIQVHSEPMQPPKIPQQPSSRKMSKEIKSETKEETSETSETVTSTLTKSKFNKKKKSKKKRRKSCYYCDNVITY